MVLPGPYFLGQRVVRIPWAPRAAVWEADKVPLALRYPNNKCWVLLLEELTMSLQIESGRIGNCIK